MLKSSHLHTHWDWPYPLALDWMSAAKERLLRTGDMSIAIGSHDRNLVTLGRHTSEADILDAQRLQSLDAAIYRIDRGGGATLHGPGQIVVYPIVSLSQLQLSVPLFTSRCENAMIECLKQFGIKAHTKEKQPGVFVDNTKVGAIGFHVSQNCVTHGLSLNVSNDLSLYNAIAPCGVREARVSSMESLLKRSVDIQSVAQLLLDIFTGR